MNKIYWIAFITIIRKEFVRFMRIWPQTLLPPAITSTLYFMIFGHLLGSQIGAIQGFQYIQYIAPGLVMMQIVNNAYANVVSSFFSIRFQKSIEEMIVAPIPNAIILLGFTFAGILRGVLVGIIITMITLFFTHLQIHNFVLILTSALLAALLFSLAGFTNALFAKKFDDIAIIPTFVLTPLTYLGGIFYSIHILSPFWHNLSLLNPILYMVNIFRYGILGISDIAIGSALTILVLSCAILFYINLYFMNKGVGIRT